MSILTYGDKQCQITKVFNPNCLIIPNLALLLLVRRKCRQLRSGSSQAERDTFNPSRPNPHQHTLRPRKSIWETHTHTGVNHGAGVSACRRPNDGQIINRIRFRGDGSAATQQLWPWCNVMAGHKNSGHRALRHTTPPAVFAFIFKLLSMKTRVLSEGSDCLIKHYKFWFQQTDTSLAVSLS